jgi:hypothetical protein
MLVDGGAIVNLMQYSLFKKLGGSNEELIKTNMTVSGVGGGKPIWAKGVKPRIFIENPNPCTIVIVPGSVAIAYRTSHR